MSKSTPLATKRASAHWNGETPQLIKDSGGNYYFSLLTRQWRQIRDNTTGHAVNILMRIIRRCVKNGKKWQTVPRARMSKKRRIIERDAYRLQSTRTHAEPFALRLTSDRRHARAFAHSLTLEDAARA